MTFQLILLVLLTPTKYCFQDQVTPPSDKLWVVNQTFTKLDMRPCLNELITERVLREDKSLSTGLTMSDP